MEQMDQAQAQRVWQRVRNQPEPPELGDLFAREQTLAWMYAQLSRQSEGRLREQARKLWERKRDRCAFLRGMAVVSGKDLQTSRGEQPAGKPAQLLHACAARELELLALYEKWAGHPEYGGVFAMAQSEQAEECAMVVQRLGAR